MAIELLERPLILATLQPPARPLPQEAPEAPTETEEEEEAQ
jgi:hypothetical protein